MDYREHSITCRNQQGEHRMTYYEWGDPDNDKVLICVHGLARSGRDFDHLAAALADEYRVVCPDVVGRGKSDWLPLKADYGYPQYIQDLLALVAQLQPRELHWVGTSMGGMIGMLIAAQPGNPIARLVLNDVGAVLGAETVGYLQAWFGVEQRFAGLDEAVDYCRTIYTGFGQLSEQEWREVARNTVRPAPDGEGLVLHYDPGIADNVKALERQEYAVWEVWDALQCPVLLLHGTESIVLSAATVQEMLRRGPATELVEFEGIGHAPTLTRQEQIRPIRDWLLR